MCRVRQSPAAIRCRAPASVFPRTRGTLQVGGGVAVLGALVDVCAPVVVCPLSVVAGGGGGRGGGAVVVGAGGVVVPVVSVPVEPALVTVKSPFINVGWASHWK